MSEETAINELEVQQAFDSVANPNKKYEEKQETTSREEAPPTEVTPQEPTLDEKFKDMQEQLTRVSELEKQREKRMRDDGSRIGTLSKVIEELQQKLATSSTQKEAATNSAELDEALEEFNNVFPGVASKLKTNLDPEAINTLVTTRIAAERQAERKFALEKVTERHEDFFAIKDTPEFETWKKTLSPHERATFIRSMDPGYVGDMIDEFKTWKSDEAKKIVEQAKKPVKQQPVQQKNNARLEAALLPTNGAKPAILSGPSDAEQVREAYERVRGKRL